MTRCTCVSSGRIGIVPWPGALLSIALLFLGSAAAGEEVRPGVLRTPEERFVDLPDYPFAPHYVEIQGYRVHYLDEGARDGKVILLLHGEPTWSYLYRRMIPPLVDRGYRCIVPDLVGFGKSDKPVAVSAHTYAFHVAVITELLRGLECREMLFFGQDWGGLIGLRVVAENPDWFTAVVIANTALPSGDERMSPGFALWKMTSRGFLERGDMAVGRLVSLSCRNPDLAAAYDAPFPDRRYKAGPLALPQLVPVDPDDPARAANRAAWEVLRRWEKPFVTAFGDADPITRGMEKKFQEQVPGAQRREHPTLQGAGHFLQETHAKQLSEILDAVIGNVTAPTPASAGPA